MANPHYRSEVFWSEEDEGYIATVPDLPGCSAFGDSKSEAVAELEDAISSWIMAAKAAGNAVPKPSVREAFEERSGKVLLRMPKELHYNLVTEASLQGTSLNQYVCYLLVREHTAHDVARSIWSGFQLASHRQTVGNTTQQVIMLQNDPTKHPLTAAQGSNQPPMIIAAFQQVTAHG